LAQGRDGFAQTNRSRQSITVVFGTVPSRHLRGIGLDLMAASPAPSVNRSREHAVQDAATALPSVIGGPEYYLLGNKPAKILDPC
jgi:hypothetical protein